MVETKTTINPFPGLRPYKQAENYLFFGREKQTDQLLKRLRQTHFLAVVGASGSGKSSLVKCGLLPALHSGFMTKAGTHWNIGVFTPGSNPIGRMAQTLAPILYAEDSKKDQSTYTSIVETTLRRSSVGLVKVVQEGKQHIKHNLLLVVDQFEEIFRFNRKFGTSGENHQDADSFIRLLLEASKQRTIPIYVVFTMRSDFLGDCTLFRGLAEAINEGQYLIPRMTRAEQKEAILGPVAVGGASISPQLVTKLLNDVGNSPDQLPILQHALMRTWNYWEKNHPTQAIDIRDYESVGMMASALSEHAEEAFSELKTEQQRRICEVMFKTLTDKGTDNRGIRRPTPLQEICLLAEASEKEVIEVIETFRTAGRSFLMPPYTTPLDNNTIIDISHESLMRVWGRLIQWVEEETQSADIYIRLAEAAELYQRGQSALWRNPELQLALRWQENTHPNATWAQRYNPSFERAINFLETSQKEYEFAIAEKERRQQLRIKRTRRVALFVSLAAILALLLSIYALLQRGEAIAQKKAAETAQGEAEEQKEIALKSEEEAIKQKGLAEESAKEANRQAAIAEKNAQEANRQKAIATANEQKAIKEHKEAIKQKKIAEEQKREADKLKDIAQESEKKAIKNAELAEKNRLEAVANAKEALSQKEQTERLRDLERSRNSSNVVLRLLNEGKTEEAAQQAIAAHKLNRKRKGPIQNSDNYEALQKSLVALQPEDFKVSQKSSVRAVSFLPKTNNFITGNERGKVNVLRVDDEKISSEKEFTGIRSRIRSLSYAPNGQYIVGGTVDGKIIVWDAKEKDKPKEIIKEQTNGIIHNLGFLKVGAQDVLVYNTKNVVKLKIIKDDKLIAIGEKSFNQITAMFITLDGKYVVVAEGQDYGIYSIEKNTLKMESNATLTETIISISMTKDKKYLAAGLKNGHIYLAALNKAFGVTKYKNESVHRSRISNLAFYQFKDGLIQLASSSLDHSAKLINVKDWITKKPSEDVLDLKGHDKWIYKVNYTTDGNYLITTSEDFSIRMWPTRSDVAAKKLSKMLK